MTGRAQAAAGFYEDVDTALGFNSGMPRMWPRGGFPGDPSDGLPAEVSKPFLMIISSNDDFVHMVFRRIHWQMFKAAGGDPRENYPLRRGESLADRGESAAGGAFCLQARHRGKDVCHIQGRESRFRHGRRRRTLQARRDDKRRARPPVAKRKTRDLPNSGLDQGRRQEHLLDSPDAQLLRDQLVRLAAEGRRDRPRTLIKTSVRARGGSRPCTSPV